MNSYSHVLARREWKPERSAGVCTGFKHLLAIHFHVVVGFGFQAQDKCSLIAFLCDLKCLAFLAKRIVAVPISISPDPFKFSTLRTPFCNAYALPLR